MPNYFFTDSEGIRRGPITDERLQTLAERGVITPNTPLETEGGHTGLAGQIPGLQFNTAPLPSFVQQEQTTSYSQETPSYLQTGESGEGMMRWFDFAFSDIRIPRTIRRISGYIYGCYWVWGVIFVILGTMSVYDTYEDEVVTLMFFVFYALTFIFTITIVRLFCEWQIVLMDWLIKNSKKD